MVNFNSLSEGEKFTFSKQFLIQYNVIKKLKPTLTDEKDILYLVADKCYDGNVRVLEDCIRFMASKTQFNSLDEVRLDESAEEYIKKLEENEKAKKQDLEAKTKAEEDKIKEYSSVTKKRNDALENYQAEARRQNINKSIKVGVIAILVIMGCVYLSGLGGVAGLINSLIAVVSDLSFVQTATLAVIGYWGFSKDGFASIWGKIKDARKNKADKKKKDLEKLAAEKDAQESKHKELADQQANAKLQKQAADEGYNSTKAFVASERGKLANYDKLSEFDKRLRMSEIAIKSQYNKAKESVTSEEELKTLEDWQRQYIGSLYYGAYKGNIQTRDDFISIQEQAKEKFNQLLNPLYVNSTYSDDNVRAGLDPRTNRPLEEMYEAI